MSALKGCPDLRDYRVSQLFGPVILLLLASSCAIGHPCKDGGDVYWVGPEGKQIKGDMRCFQTKLRDGSFVNQGNFYQWHPNGKIALEGEFKDGRKNSTWTQYDENGQKIMVKVFENGVEKSTEVIRPDIVKRIKN